MVTKAIPEPLRRQIDHYAAQIGQRTVEQVLTQPKESDPHEPRRWWVDGDR